VSGTNNDPFRNAVPDTIVEVVHNAPGDDRCVQMLGMFKYLNPGLKRRLEADRQLIFKDFIDAKLIVILCAKDFQLTCR